MIDYIIMNDAFQEGSLYISPKYLLNYERESRISLVIGLEFFFKEAD